MLTTHPLTVHKRPAAAVYCLPCEKWPVLQLGENAHGIVGLCCPECPVRYLEGPVRESTATQEEMFHAE